MSIEVAGIDPQEKMKQMMAEAVAMQEANAPTVATVVEQLSLVDSYIYTLKKQVHKLAIKDATSVSYSFALQLLEMFVNIRNGIIGEFTAFLFHKATTEQVGIALEQVVATLKSEQN